MHARRHGLIAGTMSAGDRSEKRDRQRPKSWVARAALVWLLVAGNGYAAAQVATYERDPNTVVVKYAEVLGEVGDSDRGPTVHIYGDGRVVVHYPAYMKRAGDYTLTLSGPELDALVDSLIAKGVADFDTQAARTAKRNTRDARRRAAASHGFPTIDVTASDASTTVIELRVGSTPRKVSWYSLRADAQEYADVEAIRDLAAAEQELRALMQRPDLQRVE